MQDWASHCRQPAIIAGRLAASRNIYLRQELCAIAEQIQEKYQDRVPVLDLLAITAYEQVFLRQHIRRDAIKYALKYYELNRDKLQKADSRYGLDTADAKSSHSISAGSTTSDSSDRLPNETTSEKSSSSDPTSAGSATDLPRRQPPTIIVRRPSENTLRSNRSHKSSSKPSINADHLSPNKPKTRKKRKRRK